MEQVFETFYWRLYYFAKKLTDDTTESEDIAQEALLSFWINIKDKGTRPDNITSYLFGIVRNRCYTFNQRSQMKVDKANAIIEQFQISEALIEEQLIREDIFNRVYQEFGFLPAQQAEVMRLIFIEGLETNEIAQRLNMTPNNIRNHKARGIEKIRSLILQKGLFILILLLILLIFY